jgi:hypothetical protein
MRRFLDTTPGQSGCRDLTTWRREHSLVCAGNCKFVSWFLIIQKVRQNCGELNDRLCARSPSRDARTSPQRCGRIAGRSISMRRSACRSRPHRRCALRSLSPASWSVRWRECSSRSPLSTSTTPPSASAVAPGGVRIPLAPQVDRSLSGPQIVLNVGAVAVKAALLRGRLQAEP